MKFSVPVVVARYFSDDNAVLPVLWMTSCLYIMCHPYGAWLILKVSHQGTEPPRNAMSTIALLYFGVFLFTLLCYHSWQTPV